MKIEGVIKSIGPIQKISEKFSKRTVIVMSLGTYPQYYPIEFVNKNTDLPDSFKTGDDVEVSINLNGREWTSPSGEVKYFVTIEGWQMSLIGTRTAPVNIGTVSNEARQGNGEDDDLPF